MRTTGPGDAPEPNAAVIVNVPSSSTPGQQRLRRATPRTRLLRDRISQSTQQHADRRAWSARPRGAAWFDGPSWVRHHWWDHAAQSAINDARRRTGQTRRKLVRRSLLEHRVQCRDRSSVVEQFVLDEEYEVDNVANPAGRPIAVGAGEGVNLLGGVSVDIDQFDRERLTSDLGTSPGMPNFTSRG